MTESEFRDAVRDLLARAVALSYEQKRGILQEALRGCAPESEFRQAVHELLAQSVDGLSAVEKKALIEDAFLKQDTNWVFPLIFHHQWHWYLALGLAFLGANSTYAALEGISEWVRVLAWWVVCGVLLWGLTETIKFVVMLTFRHLRPTTAEPAAAPDPARDVGS
jgi:hypothetical protein